MNSKNLIVSTLLASTVFMAGCSQQEESSATTTATGTDTTVTTSTVTTTSTQTTDSADQPVKNEENPE
jgi:PBP1b-binding outer membrane lipoprotein LpoB